MNYEYLSPIIRSLLENTPPLSAEKLEILRAEEERDKQNFHQEISASLPRWMGKALLPKICGFPPMQWTNLWERILCALKCTTALAGKPKPILLIARCIAVSALPLNITRNAAPSLKSSPLSGKCAHSRLGVTSLFFRLPAPSKSSLHPTPIHHHAYEISQSTAGKTDTTPVSHWDVCHIGSVVHDLDRRTREKAGRNLPSPRVFL
jgi:hypothetical protein